jgi:hypothetical protein
MLVMSVVVPIVSLLLVLFAVGCVFLFWIVVAIIFCGDSGGYDGKRMCRNHPEVPTHGIRKLCPECQKNSRLGKISAWWDRKKVSIANCCFYAIDKVAEWRR